MIPENLRPVYDQLVTEILTNPMYAGMLDQLTCGGKFSQGKAAGFLALRLIAEHPELVI